MIGASLSLLGAPLEAIESISEPDTIIAGQVFNSSSLFPDQPMTEGVVEWEIQSARDASRILRFRAPIEEIEDSGEFFYQIRISHQAALGIFQVDENSVPLGMTDENYAFLEITVNGEPASVVGGANSLTISQENRGSLVRVDLEVEVESLDSDGDGIPDWWERLHGSDPYFPDADRNDDGDSRSNLEEYLNGSDPGANDSRELTRNSIEAGEELSYPFTLQIPKIVTIFTTGEVDTIGALFDDESNPVPVPEDADDEDDAGPDRNFRMKRSLAAGTYLIHVTSRVGANESGEFALNIDEQDGEFLPDLRSGKKALPGQHQGNDAISRTGQGQTLSIKAKRGRTANLFFSMENDGDVPDEIRASVSRMNRRTFETKYRDIESGKDITGSLQLGRYTADIDPRELGRIKGQVKQRKKKKGRFGLNLRIFSNYDSEKTDTNRIKLIYK